VATSAEEPAHVDGDENESSLRDEFRRRLISVRDMDRQLRLATGLAFAVLLGGGLLVALRSIGGPSVYLGNGTGEATPILAGSLVLLAVGVGYVLTGAELAAWWVTVPVLVVVTGAAVFEVGAFGNLLAGHGVGDLIPAWARWVSRLVVMGLWAVAGLVFLRDRRDRATRLLVLAVNSVLVGTYLLVIFLSVPQRGGLSFGGATVTQLMIDMAILVSPLLQVVAVDFGEWGELVGERAVRLTGRLRSGATTAGALAASAGLIAWGLLDAPALNFRYLGNPALMLAGLVLVAVVAGWRLRLHQREWREPFNYLNLLGVSGLILLVSAAVSLTTVSTVYASSAIDRYQFADPSGQFLASSGASVQRVLQGPEQFTVLVPHGMVRQSRTAITAFTDYESSPRSPGGVRSLDQLVVTAVAGSLDLRAQLQGLGADPSLAAPTGPWTLAPLSTADRAGFAAARTYLEDGSQVTAVLEATAPLDEFKAELPVLLSFLHSFRPGNQPVASVHVEENTVDPTPTWGRIIVTSLIISAVLLLIVAAGGRRLADRVVAPLVLFPLASLLALLFYDNYFGRYLVGSRADWPIVGASGLYFGLGALGMAGVALGRLRARKTLERARRTDSAILAFEVAVIGLGLMNILYGHAVSASRAAVAAAVILLVALTWEVATSGQSLLNRGSDAMPRASRVLLFSGYVVVVAGAILFFSGQRATSTGAVVESAFEPESVTQGALFRLALPVLVVITLQRVFRTEARIR